MQVIIKIIAKKHMSQLKSNLTGLSVTSIGGFTRIAASWDPEPDGTVRRNERQWSGVSLEELDVIQKKMDLKEPLTPTTLGANICVEGFPNFSQLTKGSKLIFPSGAVLIVEEKNPPCVYMGTEIERTYTTNSGEHVSGKMFPKHALHLRGVVGFVDIPGIINAEDDVIVQVCETSGWEELRKN